MIRMRSTALLLLLATLVSCGQSDNGGNQAGAASSLPQAAATAGGSSSNIQAANVTEERLLNAEDEPGQWMMVGGTYDERHYSPLDEINRDNVENLQLTWYADYAVNLSQQGTPLYIDGVIYVSTAWSMVNAFDAATGELLWHYDPQTPVRSSPRSAAASSTAASPPMRARSTWAPWMATWSPSMPIPVQRSGAS